MAARQWQPGPKHVLVRRYAAEEKSQGGILLPESMQAAERPFKGEVLGVGKECGEVRSGCECHFSRFGGVEVTLSDFTRDERPETLIVLHIDELLLTR